MTGRRGSIHVRRLSEKPAVAVRCPRQDRDRHRRDRRVRRAGGASAGRRRLQSRACRRRRRGAKKVAAECEQLGAKVETVNLRPSSAANCDKIVAAAVKRFGGVDILVLASGINKVAKIVDQAPEVFRRSDGCQCHAKLADGARRRQADAGARPRRQSCVHVVGARPARPSGRLHRLLRLEVGDRRHHQGARLRMGRDRHHRQCHRADRVPLAAHRLDV